MTLESRLRNLRCVITEHHKGPFAGAFAAVVCNGCGASVVVRAGQDLAAMAAGWTLGDELGDTDWCPTCARAVRPLLYPDTA